MTIIILILLIIVTVKVYEMAKDVRTIKDCIGVKDKEEDISKEKTKNPLDLFFK